MNINPQTATEIAKFGGPAGVLALIILFGFQSMSHDADAYNQAVMDRLDKREAAVDERFEARARVDSEILEKLSASNATQGQMVTRMDSVERMAQTQFDLVRNIRQDVNSNSKQIMILQVTDQQVREDISDIRKHVPGELNKLDVRLVSAEKDIERLNDRHASDHGREG